VVLLLVIASVADAANRRISISNYEWSDTELELDLGEHVNWYWIGPDTMHSITGTSPNALHMDSDPDTNFPQRQVGDTFELTFDAPGTYEFHCKLHSTVRGNVTVSNQPGNPTAEPDPIPEPAVDLNAPNLRNVFLGTSAFGKKGTALHYDLDEGARITADYYALRPGRKPKFAGYAGWKGGHIGINSVRFGTKRKRFPAKPGKYKARITATDRYANTTRPLELKFRIWERR
jgi:plastocyanin